MRVYWDSTALLNALAAQAVLDRLDEGERFTRSHAYVEAFHHLSGRGLPLKKTLPLSFAPANSFSRHVKQIVSESSAAGFTKPQRSNQTANKLESPVSAFILSR